MGLTTRPCATSAGPAVSENTVRAERTEIPISIVPQHTAVAGRARLKVGGLRGAPALANLLDQGLTGFGGVYDMSANALTGNITVHYDRATSLNQLIERIDGLLRGEITPLVDDPVERHWHATEAQVVASELGTSCSDGLSSGQAAAGRNRSNA
jgi:Ca2+-transporting ATPase